MRYTLPNQTKPIDIEKVIYIGLWAFVGFIFGLAAGMQIVVKETIQWK